MSKTLEDYQKEFKELKQDVMDENDKLLDEMSVGNLNSERHQKVLDALMKRETRLIDDFVHDCAVGNIKTPRMIYQFSDRMDELDASADHDIVKVNIGDNMHSYYDIRVIDIHENPEFKNFIEKVKEVYQDDKVYEDFVDDAKTLGFTYTKGGPISNQFINDVVFSDDSTYSDVASYKTRFCDILSRHQIEEIDKKMDFLQTKEKVQEFGHEVYKATKNALEKAIDEKNETEVIEKLAYNDDDKKYLQSILDEIKREREDASEKESEHTEQCDDGAEHQV